MQEANKEAYAPEPEPPQPWPSSALASPPALELHGFAPAGSLAVFDSSLPRGAPPQQLAGLPSYVLFSRNHTDGAWATRAPRRLRNVVVAMEWVPRADALALRNP